MLSRALVVASLVIATEVRAQTPAAPEDGVDVSDLPLLPVTNEEPSSSATLLAASTAEEDVVVGAAKREQTLGNVASAVTVVTADRIRRFGYRTVAEAIAGVAGVYIQDTRLTQQIGIRGLQLEGAYNSRTLVLVDGATLNEAWSAFAGVGFDAMVSIDEVARIEIIRGPVGAVYGTNAFFAIINIVTRGAVEGSRAWGRVGINSINGVVSTAGFAAGDINQQVRGSVLAMERFGESLAVDEISPDQLEADGGRTFSASIVARSGGSFAQLRAFRSRRDSPFAPYDADPGLDPTYELFNTQALIEGGHTRAIGKRLTASVRAYGNIFRYEDRIHYAVDDRFLDFGDASTIGAEVRGRYEVVGGKLGVTAGAEANYSKTESRAYTEGLEDEGVKVPLDFNTEGFYSEVDGQPTEWLGFTGGVRFDRNSVIESRLSPRGALFLAKPERYGLKLLYAEGFRNPSAYEGFFADGVDFSANPDIRSESIRSYEVVVWGRPVPGLSTRLSGFYWDARGIVEQLPDPDDMTLLQFQNTARYVTAGVEAEASYRTSSGWYGFGGATLARIGVETEGGDLEYGEVVNAPALTAAAGISTPLLAKLAHLSAEVQFIGKRTTRPDEDGNASPRTPAWTGLNATVYFPNVAGFDLTVGARNLLGKADLSPAPGDYDRFPDPDTTVLVPRIPGEGRELYAKVGYSF